MVSTTDHICKPPKGDGSRCPEGLSVPCWHATCCKCSMETTRNSVKVKLGIKVMKLVENLINLEVTGTGQGPECHLTFVRGGLHIAE